MIVCNDPVLRAGPKERIIDVTYETDRLFVVPADEGERVGVHFYRIGEAGDQPAVFLLSEVPYQRIKSVNMNDNRRFDRQRFVTFDDETAFPFFDPVIRFTVQVQYFSGVE